MKVRATKAWTPVGYWPAPMHPGFAAKLAKCETNEDLFALCGRGLMDPDAFNEILARRLVPEYERWRTGG